MSDVNTFICPSDFNNPIRSRGSQTNYMADMGSGIVWQAPIGPNMGMPAPNGVFHGDSATRFAAITDGLSNTWMVGETLPGHCTFMGIFSQNFPTSGTGIPLNTMEDRGVGKPGEGTLWYRSCGFKSLHPAGANFALGDASAGRVIYESGKGTCIACHNGLVTPSGQDVSIASNWRTSMMANASHDPYWQASLRREVLEHPSADAVIQDECSTCHMPMQRYQARAEGLRGEVLKYLQQISSGAAMEEPEP